MNIIETFITKYNGIYFEEEEKSAHTPHGKYITQAKSGKTFYKGNKIAVGFNEVGGANNDSELFRMKMILDKPLDVEFLLFPRSFWSRMFRVLFFGKNSSIEEKINQQYQFTGSKELIARLKKNHLFMELIDGEFLCINLSIKKPKKMVITPSHGHVSVEHLEKLADILTLIKELVFDKQDYSYVKAG
ncbi:MAG: hypothetical protein ACI8ZM_004810 [Crocinitomix sp.]|jgi:hypothetical protein